ncbi:MAG: nucleotidyl transferase AbiEii/AbiGii toxin family protein [Bacteroidota bacterium]|nr:nucleotidyl transferase AbiEii/AbiGii toxin family protein [Bacteroidota bacterium]
MKTYKELSLPFLGDVYRIIANVCKTNSVSCYLIGAQARDINLLESGIRPSRGTKDIDFAIMLPDMVTYEKIVSDLLNAGFRDTKMPYRIIHDETNTVVDLLPFGQIEEEGTVKFTEREIEISVVGFREVNEIVQDVSIEDENLRVSPMEGLFILKLISWNEKPFERKKDLIDLQFILKNYFEINQERFYSEHLDCIEQLPEAHFQLGAGARLLGRDMAEVLKLSVSLKSQILHVIDKRLRGNIGVLSENSSAFYDDNEKLDRELIELIKKGILEKTEI